MKTVTDYGTVFFLSKKNSPARPVSFKEIMKNI